MKDGNKCRVDVLRGGEFLSGIFPHLDGSPRCGIISVLQVGPSDRFKAASSTINLTLHYCIFVAVTAAYNFNPL